MKKINVTAAILIAAIVIVSTIPSAISETEGAKLEFTDFFPASLTYNVGERLAVAASFYNTGTEVIEDATVCINVIALNGTYVYDFSYTVGEEGFEPDTVRKVHSRYLWLIAENTTAGKYTIEAILRWGSEVFQKNTFFYVPEESNRTEPGLEITSLYTQRISYKPNEDITCTCRIKNEANESIDYYISMCMFDHNETMIKSMAGNVYSIEPDKTIINKFILPANSKPEIYTIESILWWNDIATSKSTKFYVNN